MALAAYRAIIRSAKIAFQGDSQTLTAALASTRAGFEQNRTLPAADIPAAINDAHEIAGFLRKNLVQGQRIDAEAAAAAEAMGETVVGLGEGQGEKPVYRLRLHDEIERGDNESIKTAGKGKVAGGGCCGGGC
ncbi:hypothetical protein EX30DRAFT_368389 [Ascodesmis nigricans]|uniref:Mitochondrial zinc maintenance protein 1, mitochondrial n=1 Tax=Ascodesmis nigricans TaxID=341454 RepID=A0A4S2N7F9_9PEZI|nr:hypothetical protein EX30DRAFT_368389 [Ascodesmis nigricans]